MSFFDEHMVELLKEAAKETFISLLRKNEKFYYFSLLIDEGMFPYISAWSYEALDNIVSEIVLNNTIEFENEKLEYKWSPCDSPYCAYEHNLHFKKVDKLIEIRNANMNFDKEFEYEFAIRLNSMEEAMKQLDYEGFFGSNDDRKNIIISVEVIPPDFTNTSRIKRLNPHSNSLIQEWLELCAEPEE